MIVASGPLCRVNVQIYLDKINAKFARNFERPVVYYGQSISVAHDLALETRPQTVIQTRAKKLEEIAAE
jgi:heterodisulfide reductase subunit B